MIVAAAGSSGTTYWYLTRGTGAVALVLLTLVVVLGVVEVGRFSSDRWPRFLIDAVHRRVSVLALVFLILHILTTLLDGFAPISVIDAIIPFHSAYRPLWLGLGAIAFDLMLAVLISSLVRTRIGHRRWRAIHWLAYASWPVAVLHGFGTGSDVKQAWMLLIDVACIAAVVIAVAARVLTTPAITPGIRNSAIGVAVVFVIGLAIWVPTGPLASGWAARAGTPASLLPHTTTGASR